MNELPDRRGINPKPKGQEHYRWNSGRLLSSHGYVKVRVGKGHPDADPNGYAYEHLLAWLAAGNERPGVDDVLHHVNEDKTDNRIGNLCLMNRGKHTIEEHLDRDVTTGQFRRKAAAGRLLDGVEWNEYPEAPHA